MIEKTVVDIERKEFFWCWKLGMFILIQIVILSPPKKKTIRCLFFSKTCVKCHKKRKMSFSSLSSRITKLHSVFGYFVKWGKSVNNPHHRKFYDKNIPNESLDDFACRFFVVVTTLRVLCASFRFWTHSSVSILCSSHFLITISTWSLFLLAHVIYVLHHSLVFFVYTQICIAQWWRRQNIATQPSHSDNMLWEVINTLGAYGNFIFYIIENSDGYF